jgi:hypothetical protein
MNLSDIIACGNFCCLLFGFPCFGESIFCLANGFGISAFSAEFVESNKSFL